MLTPASSTSTIKEPDKLDEQVCINNLAKIGMATEGLTLFWGYGQRDILPCNETTEHKITKDLKIRQQNRRYDNKIRRINRNNLSFFANSTNSNV